MNSVKETASNPIENKTKSNFERPMLNKKRSDKIAVLVTNTFGSITFLFICILFFSLWILCNLNLLPSLKPFDPFPFPALEMGVSIFAIVLSVSVLISQKRQGRMEKISQDVEFEINIQAEKEITKILEMLHNIQKKLHIDQSDDELEQMKENIDLQELHEKAETKHKE
jgi:uncharacterized membrane protein